MDAAPRDRATLARLVALTGYAGVPAAHDPLPAAHGSSPATHGSSPATHGPSPATHGPSPAAHGPSPATHGPSPASKARPVVSAAILSLARDEGLAPLLGGRLRAGALFAESASVAAALEADYRACLARNLAAQTVLHPVFEELARRRIPVLLHKGAALVRLVYRDPGLRPMGDVDFFVPATRWQDLLAAARAVGAAPRVAPRRPLTVALDYERTFTVGGIAKLDAHRSVSDRPQFAVDYEALFARATPDDDGLLLPDPVDLFVLSAAHAAKHGFVMLLRSAVDGLALVSVLRPAPDAVVRRATEWRACRATAAWIRMLVGLGLSGDDWPHAAQALDPNRRRARLGEEAPFAMRELTVRDRLRVAALLDDTVRRLAWVGGRAVLRVADRVLGHFWAAAASGMIFAPRA